MLRKIRIVLAALFLLGITLLFAGIGTARWGWMAKIQLLPATMRVVGSATALNIAVVAAILLVTLIFGRIYCSIICPLGVFQDVVNNLSSRRKGKKNRFHFKPESKLMRYGLLAFYLVALILGVQVAVALLAPYSAYGRIVRIFLAPMGMGWATLTVAVLTLVAVALLAWTGGRSWCNTICPVGSFLGLISRFAIIRPVIDEDKCIGCHSCEKKCKASCIDSENKKIDYSRCVDCFDCISDCKAGAISYRSACGKKKNACPAPEDSPKADAGRRAFIAGSAIALTSVTLGAQEQKLDGGLAAIEEKKKPVRTERIVPAGAQSIKNFYDRCTACQLCVSACPNNVLRPSTDLQHLMQPEASFENGYCRPECSACSQVCPAGAILPVTPEERTQIHVGRAVVDLDLCVVNRDGVSCGNCSRHCPAQAVKMVHKDASDNRSPMIPTVIEDKCIGCGACEYLCPSRPYSAIHVNGLKVHING